MRIVPEARVRSRLNGIKVKPDFQVGTERVTYPKSFWTKMDVLSQHVPQLNGFPSCT